MTSPLEAVCAKPTDLTRRQVLADALLERGDLQGEFIALQLGRLERGDPKATRREQSLAKAHGTRWLGRLAKYVKAPLFEGGLVSAATLLDVRFSAADAAWPEWALLTSLTRAAKQSPVPLLASARLKSLRAVERLLVSELVQLTRERGALPYSSIGLRLSPLEDLEALSGLHALLPALTTLSLASPRSSMGSLGPSFDDLKPFLASKVFSSLRELSLGLASERELELMLQHVARAKKLERFSCQLEGGGKPVVVDLLSKRIEAPGELAELQAPRGFELVLTGVSKAVERAQRQWAEFELIQALEGVDEWELARKLRFKQPMTKAMRSLVDALKAGECTPETIDAWRAARSKR